MTSLPYIYIYDFGRTPNSQLYLEGKKNTVILLPDKDKLSIQSYTSLYPSYDIHSTKYLSKVCIANKIYKICWGKAFPSVFSMPSAY